MNKASDVQVGGGHYKRYAIQPGEFIHRNRIGFLEGNVIKYVCRHGEKNGRQDIEKAIHYLQLLLEWEYPLVPAADAKTCGCTPGGCALEDGDELMPGIVCRRR